MAETTKARRDSGELSALLISDLRKVANNLGIEGYEGMKKPELVEAISNLQAANREAAKAEREARRAERQAKRDRKNNRGASGENQESNEDEENEDFDNDSSEDQESNNSREYKGSDRVNEDNSQEQRNDQGYDRGDRWNRRDRGNRRDRNDRFDRGNRRDRGDREITISEDDVLLPVGGLLDILENYAFIRTSGYLPSPYDVYVGLQLVRRYGLRKGDVITGQVRRPREGE